MKRLIQFKYRVIVLFIELITLILIALLLYNSLSISTHKTTFYLSSSDTDSVLKALNSHGYQTYILDDIVLNMMQAPPKGWYSLGGKKQGRFMFFKTLHTKQAKTMQVKIYAGETSKELTKRLANDMKLDAQKLLNVYHSLSRFKEANIFSGRYSLARDADENTTMTYLYEQSNAILDAFIHTDCQDKPDFFALKVLFIIASIIQKESNSKKEMPLISSVIYNRLAKGMKLQMDGTLNYGTYAHTVITPERIKTDESSYNTYKHKGLPPEPLSTISLAALKAACHPASSDYLFFMLNKDGTHNFAATYAEHLENIRTFRAKHKENNETITVDSNSSH